MTCIIRKKQKDELAKFRVAFSGIYTPLGSVPSVRELPSFQTEHILTSFQKDAVHLYHQRCEYATVLPSPFQGQVRVMCFPRDYAQINLATEVGAENVVCLVSRVRTPTCRAGTLTHLASLLSDYSQFSLCGVQQLVFEFNNALSRKAINLDPRT